MLLVVLDTLGSTPSNPIAVREQANEAIPKQMKSLIVFSMNRASLNTSKGKDNLLCDLVTVSFSNKLLSFVL
jgi:hypothetical protein